MHPMLITAFRKARFGAVFRYDNYRLRITDEGAVHEVQYQDPDTSDITLCGRQTKDLRKKTGHGPHGDNLEITEDPVNCLDCIAEGK